MFLHRLGACAIFLTYHDPKKVFEREQYRTFSHRTLLTTAASCYRELYRAWCAVSKFALAQPMVDWICSYELYQE